MSVQIDSVQIDSVQILEELKNLLSTQKEVRLLSLEDAAKEVGVGINNFRKMASKKDFPFVKLSAKKLVIMADLPKWFSDHRGEQLC